MTPLHASVTHSTTQSVNDTTTTYLSFDTLISQSNGMYITSATDRITVPIRGLWLCTALVQWEANAVGIRSTAISGQTPAAVEKRATVDSRVAVTGGTGTSITLTAVFDLEAGDIVRVRVVQTSTGALLVTSSAPASMLTVSWLGHISGS